MTGIAVLIMLAAVVIIWGGLAVSITALVSRGRREDRDARAEASARAREHMLNPEQVD
ncbi:methionine/alanine import family NSS transporter small subunit [Actinomyces naeslundii]|uniref:methionine/alanine import family NSS transporter small subunit n=1 Tax=Actinomyces naeslundii TaxID=1655 RepID=UPI00096F01FF|nr:methionine/alanine import family NSS transporter small subunit [Actinomyces naeslundii]OMG36333.1 putative methionine/alanine importer small subunit [Actinomyces naeslundii]